MLEFVSLLPAILEGAVCPISIISNEHSNFELSSNITFGDYIANNLDNGFGVI